MLDRVDAKSSSGSIFQEYLFGMCALGLCEHVNVSTSRTGWSASDDDDMNVRKFTLCSSLPMSTDS